MNRFTGFVTAFLLLLGFSVVGAQDKTPNVNEQMQKFFKHFEDAQRDLNTPGGLDSAIKNLEAAKKIFFDLMATMKPADRTRLKNGLSALISRMNLFLAQAKKRKGLLNEAKEEFETTIKELEEISEKEDISLNILHHSLHDIGVGSVELGYLYSELGDEKKAFLTHKKAVDVLSELPPDHPNLAKDFSVAYYALAQRHMSLGNMNEAFESILNALKYSGGQNADIQLLMSEYFIDQNLFSNAIQRFEKAKEILGDQGKGPLLSFADARFIISQAKIEEALGMFEAARDSSKNLLQFYESFLDSKHPAIFSARTNLARLEGRLGNSKESYRLYKKAIDNVRLDQFANLPEVVRGLIALANTSLDEGDDALFHLNRAENLLEKCDGISENQRWEIESGILAGYGNVHMHKNEFEKSESRFEAALEITRKRCPSTEFPLGHIDEAIDLANLAKPVAAQGRIDEAAQLIDKSLGIRLRIWNARVHLVSGSEAIQTRAKLQEYLDAVLALTADSPDSDEQVYQLCLKVQNAIFNAHSTKQNAIRNSTDSQETIDLIHQFRGTNEKIKQLLIQFESAPDENENLSDELDNLLEKRTEQSRKISLDLESNSKDLKIPQVLPNELAKKIPEESSLLDIVRYRKALVLEAESNEESYGYAAFVVNQAQLIRVELGDADDIDQCIVSWRSALISEKPNAELEAKLYGMVWQKLEPHLKNIETVLIAPDGVFGTFPWNAIRNGPDQPFLIHRHNFVIVPSGVYLHRLLSTEPNSSATDSNALVVADVDYGENNEGKSDPDEHWDQLDRTRQFAKTIVELLGEKRVTWMSGKAPTADSVKKELATPNHAWAIFDTHAFYQNSQSESDWPLQKCRIVLANSNVDQMAGTLTGDEITDIDLSAYDLIGLLACESVAGDMIHGEGLFNFQRSFHLAGARSVVGSLWPVQEKHTNEIMKKVFSRVLQNTDQPIASVLRQCLIEATENSDPYFWATWTFSGDAWLKSRMSIDPDSKQSETIATNSDKPSTAPRNGTSPDGTKEQRSISNTQWLVIGIAAVLLVFVGFLFVLPKLKS